MLRSSLRVLGCLCVLSVAFSAFAQNARFTGQVTDSQGAAIPEAAVHAINQESLAEADTKSDATGTYIIPFLPAGRYRIEVQTPGFGARESAILSLAVGQVVVYNVQLTLSSAQATVNVNTNNEVTQVETQNAEVSGTVTGKEVTAVGLNGRNFTQFIASIAGVSNQTQQDEAKVGLAGSVAFSINGGRTEYNSFSVDGSDVLNVGLNRDHSTLDVYPSLDAIQEIKILTSNYGAMYPSTGSGTTIVTTKSGTDNYHGEVYEFLRNEALNAKGYFDVTSGAPLYRRNDFGGTIGGPLSIPRLYDAKGKTHFFFSEEVRLEKSPTAYRQPVPSPAERNGDFSDVCPGVGGTFNRNVYPDCPLSVGSSGSIQANFVPINRNAQAILDTEVIPFPNATSGCNTTIGSCYNVDVSLPTYWREELFRIDHTINPKLQAGFRYIHDEWDQTTPVPPYAFIQNSFPTINSRYYGPGISMVGRLTATISPTWLNEFVASYTDSYIKLTDLAAPGVSIQRPAALDAPCSTDKNGKYQCPLNPIFNNGSKGLDGASKLPGIVIAGNNSEYGGVGFGVDPGYAPWRHTNPIYSISDNVNKILSRQNLQFGGQWIIFQRNEDNTPIGAATGETQGILTFNNVKCASYTGNSFADFLYYYYAPTAADNPLADPAGISGNVCSYQQDSGQEHYRQRYQIFEPYLQDDFKVTPRFTLNAGLRLSLFGLFHTVNNNVYNWESSHYKAANALAVDPTTGQLRDPATGNPILLNRDHPQSGLDPRVLNGLLACGPSGCMSNHLVNPSPRVGMAWDVFGDGKMSLRAGYGIFFEHGTADEANTGSLEGSAPDVLDETAQFPTSWNSIGNGVAYPLNVTAIPGKAIWTYVQQWSLGVERELPENMLLSVGYVGSKGTHLATERQINQLKPLAPAANPFGPHEPFFRSGFEYAANVGDCQVQGTNITGGTPYYQLANGAIVGQKSPAFVNMEAACFGSSAANLGGAAPTSSGPVNINPNSLRQYAPGLGEIYSLENIADSHYESLQVTLRRARGPLNLSVAYTYSHSIDDASDRSDTTFVNSFDISSNRASSNFDQRHLVHILYDYRLPAVHIVDKILHFADSDPSNLAAHPVGETYDPKTWASQKSVNALLSGWELSGVTIFETGIPFTVINNGSPSGVSVLDNAGVANGQGYGSYPDVIGNPHRNLPKDNGNNFGSVGPLLLNPGGFAAPRGLTFGDAGRNVLNNPSRWNWDIGLLRTFSITESTSLQFRAESFNTFNNTQFRIYDPTLGPQAQNTISCYGGAAANYSGGGGDGVDCLTAKSFLHPVDAHRPRTLQFALKLSF